jgi:hypothetical protein
VREYIGKFLHHLLRSHHLVLLSLLLRSLVVLSLSISLYLSHSLLVSLSLSLMIWLAWRGGGSEAKYLEDGE